MVNSPDDRQSDFPPHWNFDEQMGTHPFKKTIILPIQQLLCIVGFGRADLKGVWDKSSGSDWSKLREDVKNRLYNIDIVVCLL